MKKIEKPSSSQLPNITIDEMWEISRNIETTQELVDIYVKIHNRFWFIEDDLYDYDVGTPEYEAMHDTVFAWYKLMDYLEKRIVCIAKEEGMLEDRKPNSGLVAQLKKFMWKYGYQNGSGWWIKP